jgi:hypothetical protein
MLQQIKISKKKQLHFEKKVLSKFLVATEVKGNVIATGKELENHKWQCHLVKLQRSYLFIENIQ